MGLKCNIRQIDSSCPHLILDCFLKRLWVEQARALREHASPHVRECKTVLNSGFHASDTGFRIPFTGFQSLAVEFRIPCCIPNSKAKDSVFHMQNFPADSTGGTFPDSGFRIPSWMERKASARIYSWTSPPQRLLWGQKKVAVVERFLKTRVNVWTVHQKR